MIGFSASMLFDWKLYSYNGDMTVICLMAPPIDSK